MLMLYKKGENAVLSTNFRSSEFDCECKKCTETKIDLDLIIKLEAFRTQVGHPIRINSGYRCQAYQDDLRARGFETSLGPSTHTEGRAADVSRADSGSTGLELEVLARSAGFTSVGVGGHWCHLDLRSGYRRWEYKS